ncbi:MAG: flagellar basal body rod protein FlgC [Burkholderiales bacterium]|nr:flagellar basal body rod protein FlgC [Burkholderiales bacterium]
MNPIFKIAGLAMTAQSQRLNAVASNLANAESTVSSTGEPYRAKQVVFAIVPLGSPAAQGVKVAAVIEDASPLKRVFDPKHPAADESGYLTLPNVNVVDEMVNMISASRSFQTSVELMNTAKQLALKTLSIGQ